MTLPVAHSVAWITGASSGIGLALARELRARGYAVALSARRREKLEELAHSLDPGGNETLVLPADVTRRDELDAAVRGILARFGRLDLVIANAGFGVAGRFDRLATDDYRRQFDTNFFGALDTAYAALPALRSARGRLAFIGSVVGRVPLPGQSAYCASKFALSGLVLSIRHELAREGITVTLVSPGFVESEIRQVDNEGRHHPNAKDPIPRWLVLPASDAARVVVDGIEDGKREVVVTWHGKIAVLTYRLFPWLAHFGFSRLGIRSRRPVAR